MTTKLTDSQKQTIRKALAKWMGWEGGVNISGDPVNDWGKPIPNYPASLDACHEIELKLTDEQHKAFRSHLAEVTRVTNYLLEREPDIRAKTSATSEHRSFALFLALNLGELGD